MKFPILISLIIISNSVFCQNLVLNPGFEDGAIPNNEGQVNKADNWKTYKLTNCIDYTNQMADLFDTRSSHCRVDIPKHKWSPNKPIRQGGVGNRYVGFTPIERIIGTLSENLRTNCQYKLEFYASAFDNLSTNPCNFIYSSHTQYTQVEVYLVENGCAGNRIKIYDEGITLTSGWNLYSKTITLSASQNTGSFNRIEFRFKTVNIGIDGGFLDDISLTKINPNDCACTTSQAAVADFIVVNYNSIDKLNSKFGLIDVYKLCLSQSLLVDGSPSGCETSYWIHISEFNLTTWVSTNVLYENWVCTSCQVPNNINIVSFLPNGYHLKPGIIYKFSLAVSSPWNSKDFYFRIDCC